MENLNGLMEENTKDNGLMENNMEKVFILTPREKKNKENGLMEKELNGLKMIDKKITDCSSLFSFFKIIYIYIYLVP